MRNPAPYLRKTLFTLLDGNVTYDGATVPVVESGSGDLVPYQIFIGEYSDGDRSNKHGFEADASQVVEVVGEQGTAVKKHVDEIGDLVMNIIHPTTQSNLLSSTDFNVCVQGRPSINHVIENSGDGTYIVRLILRYNLLIGHN
jgi:hypothetical protein